MAMSVTHALVSFLDAFTPCRNKERDIPLMQKLVHKILQNSLRHFPIEQQRGTVESLKDSAKIHSDEYRDDDVTPYIIHLLETTCILIDAKVLEFKILCAAMLHDVVEKLKNEDDPLLQMKKRLREIHKKYCALVSMIVDFLTKRPDKDKDTYWKRMLSIKDRTLLWGVLAIKYADRIHNMRTIHGMKNKESMVRKIEETRLWFPQIREKLEKALSYLTRDGTLKNRSYRHLPAVLDNQLQAALMAYN